MTEIIPAILPNDWNDLREKTSIVSGKVPLVHIDIEDGTLTSNKSWPLNGNDEQFERLKKEESGLPYWEELNFEAHLMIADPESAYEDWVNAGIERIIIHYESFSSSEKLSEFLNKLTKHFSLRDNFFGIEVGLAVNYETLIQKIIPHVLECDFIHLMSIKELGKQGEILEEGIFDKINELRKEYPETLISVDGGVNLENAELLVESGVQRLVIGSAIYESGDPIATLEDFISISE